MPSSRLVPRPGRMLLPPVPFLCRRVDYRAVIGTLAVWIPPTEHMSAMIYLTRIHRKHGMPVEMIAEGAMRRGREGHVLVHDALDSIQSFDESVHHWSVR